MTFRPTIKPESRLVKNWINPLKNYLGEPPDLVIREHRVSDHRVITLVYLQNTIDEKKLTKQVLVPLEEIAENQEDITPDHIRTDLQTYEISDFKTVEELGSLLIQGFAAILIKGRDGGLAVNTGLDLNRGHDEPLYEKITLGPHVGFNENIKENLALIRRYVNSPALRFRQVSIPTARSKVLIAYVNKKADPDVVQEVEKRLKKVKVDHLLDPHYLEEWITDRGLSPFPNFYYTERVDSTISNLIEGRIMLMVPNSPVAAILPISFSQILMAPDDHYYNPILASLIRILRMVALFLAFTITSFYVALTMVNHELLPFLLIQSLMQARQGIPFPIWVEVLLLEVALEIVIEASRWTPGNIAQAITLFGTLVVGQAAVQAGLLNATVIIVVALEAIASFAVPIYRGSVLIRLLRYPMILIAAVFGVLGIFSYLMLMIIHLVRKENFGYPYLSPLTPFKLSNFRDSFIRVPRPFMKRGTLNQED
ncbi:MAG: spore germination protein [Bacillaceae bacterium]|nr:spore germination protein [Bacillaceae bacterium]